MSNTGVGSGLIAWSANTFLARLASFQTEELIRAGDERLYRAGSDHVVTKSGVILVRKGVLLLEHDDGSAPGAITFCGPGDIIGAAHALPVDRRCAGSKFSAQTAAIGTEVSADVFGEFVTNDVVMARALLAHVMYQYYAEKVYRARSVLAIAEQVLLFLEDLARRFGTPWTNTWNGWKRAKLELNLTQGAIARTLGVSTGAIEIALRELRNRELIETGYRWIIVTLREPSPYQAADDS